MWSSRPLRVGLVAVALLAAATVSGCTSFRPVYGETGVVQQRLALYYKKPASRLEQIIIQDLSLKLGSTNDEDAPQVVVTAAAGSRALTRTGVVRARTEYEMTVTATYSVRQDGKLLLEGSRRASASYQTVGQVLADEAAAKDAAERASREVAETIRLSILAGLATPVREAALAE